MILTWKQKMNQQMRRFKDGKKRGRKKKKDA